MSIIIAFVVVVVVLIVLTNTKRWRRLASGARRAKHDLEEEIKTPGVLAATARGRGAVECLQRRAQRGWVEGPADEHETRAPVGVRPGVEVDVGDGRRAGRR